MKKIPISSLRELKEKRQPLKNVRKVHRQLLSGVERFAIWSTQTVGSAGFFIILTAWTIGWFSWNTFAPHQYHFDPFPSFVIWIFISNILQIFLIPLLLIGQNIENKFHEVKEQMEFDLNKQAEAEIEVVLLHLEKQQKLLHTMHDTLDRLAGKTP